MNEEAYLVIITNGKDQDGFPVTSEEKIPVFVTEKSVTRTEFYAAANTDYRPQIVFEMRQEDWEMSVHEVNGKKAYATRIEYEGYMYDVIRTYKIDKALIQVVAG